MITNNGPQFTSHEFAEFSANLDFEHVTSSPHFSQAKGEAEQAVQSAKAILKRKDPLLVLLSYRAIPIEFTGSSPAQLLFGRNIRSTVPVLPDNLTPGWPDHNQVVVKDQQSKGSYRYYYNRLYGSRVLPELQPGDPIELKSTQIEIEPSQVS